MRNVLFGTPGPYFPPVELVTAGSKYLEDSGVDYIFNGDQTMLVLPRSMQTPDLVPGVANGVDLDRWMEGFMYKTVTAMSTEKVGLSLCCDAIRRHPSLLAQMTLSMDHISHGRFWLQLGAGEHKQIGPYGIERTKPFLQLEESVKITKLLMENNSAVDYDGPVWTMRNALMALESYESRSAPKVVVLGGPGRSVEIASRVGDGWATWIPPCGDADWFAEQVSTVKRGAERRGVDPESLIFHVMASCLIIENDSEREQLSNNLAMRFHSAVEVPGADDSWKRWGGLGESPFGKDYYYTRDFVPTAWSLEAALEIAQKVPPEMVSRAKLMGRPSEVADQLYPYIEAGATHVGLGNFATLFQSGDWGDALAKSNLLLEVIAELRRRVQVANSTQSGVAKTPSTS